MGDQFIYLFTRVEQCIYPLLLTKFVPTIYLLAKFDRYLLRLVIYSNSKMTTIN